MNPVKYINEHPSALVYGIAILIGGASFGGVAVVVAVYFFLHGEAPN